MRKQKVIVDFSKKADTELDQKAAQIIEALSNPPGSVNFPTPAPTIVIVQGKLDAYTEALADLGKGKISTAIKDAASKDLEEKLADLGAYVETTSNNDVVKMLSSGFDVSKLPSPIGTLPEPENVKLMAIAKEQFEGSCTKVNGAKTYQWEIKQVTATAWTIKTTTKTKVLFTGLESGKEYEMKVVAIGTSNERE